MTPRRKFLLKASTFSIVTLTAIVLALVTSRLTDAQPPPIVPKGAIIMWEGTTPPNGWCILDGSDPKCPTPNLTGLFIKAAGSKVRKDQPGGPFPVTQVKPPVPETVKTEVQPNHVHDLAYDNGVTGGANGIFYVKEDSAKGHFNPIYRDRGAGSHDHPIKIENVPHYRLIFIKKIV